MYFDTLQKYKTANVHKNWVLDFTVAAKNHQKTSIMFYLIL